MVGYLWPLTVIAKLVGMARKFFVENRIRGIEYEYGINVLGGDYSDAGRAVGLSMEGMHERGYIIKTGNKNTTANGGVVYNDLEHLEICTPSFVSPFEAVAYDKASEIYAYIASVLASKKMGKNVIVHKTNTSTRYGIFIDNSVSYATHSSVCIKRPCTYDWERVKRSMTPFVVSRIVFSGTGDVVDRSFVISPRALYVETDSSEDTMSRRGIINERNSREWLKNEKGNIEYGWSRNYSDPRKYMRWHDIHYEGLRCDWNIFVRDAWESYIASAFEEGLLDDAPKISKPVEQFKKLSRDIKGEWKLDGEVKGEARKLDAVDDILGYYQEKVHKLFEVREKGRLDEIALRNIDLLMEKYRARDFESLKNYGIDWLTKLDWLEEYGYDIEGLMYIKGKTKAEEAKRVCNAFSWIDSKVLNYLPEENRGSGIKDDSECLFDPEASMKFFGMKEDEMRKAVNNAISHPSENTRDWFSWSVIKKFNKNVTKRGWDYILLDGKKQIILGEPFMLDRDEIGNLDGVSTVEELLQMVRKMYPDCVREKSD